MKNYKLTDEEIRHIESRRKRCSCCNGTGLRGEFAIHCPTCGGTGKAKGSIYDIPVSKDTPLHSYLNLNTLRTTKIT